ncbi:hypothetical protein D9619_012345 [Psilocybe cf. subviscida]|uniref:F-box domain-containing protein n=1 Tax=Psilocybe cf. subviscida TaxID=2480587 RepID=A0A8H5ERC2_9AGAR|nr:hypothetical protein D9619_012345 [Psilocybe cf. subviscida]
MVRERDPEHFHFNRILGVKSRINAKIDPVTAKLPVEVICRIFELYADLDHVKEQMIAARWEAAGHRSGPLPLVLNLDRRGRSPGSELVHQWLERANGRPLATRFLDIERSRVRNDSEAFKIIDIINQFSGQWKILDLSGLPYVLLKAINNSQYFDSTTPSQLSHICVSETRFDGFGDPRNSILHMSRRHRPTFLSFLSLGRPIAMNIDWTSVTQMHISQSLYSFLELMSLAAKAPLNRISISFLRNDYDPSNLPVTRLSTLRHFSVTWSPEVIHSGCLYDTLTLPSLLTSHIDSGVPSWTASSPALDHLAQRILVPDIGKGHPHSSWTWR